MPLHFEAWNEALKEQGAFLPLESHYAWAGRPTRRIVELLNEKHGWELSPDQIAESKEEAFFRLLPKVKAVPTIFEIIEKYRGQIPYAVVSGSSRDTVIETLGHLGLEKDFPVVIGAEDYLHGKPAPDCFLNAAKLLKIDPKLCLGFEDAELGLQAALAAGMDCVRVEVGSHRLSLVNKP